MKKILLLIIIIVPCISFAQKMEFGVQLNSGLFSFKGKNSVRKDGNVYVYNNGNSATVSDSISSGGTFYGGRNGLNIGAAANFKWIAPFNLFFATELGFDYSKSRTNIHRLHWDQKEAAKGKTNLIFANIYVAPTVGYRIKVKQLNIDLGVGIDVSRLVDSYAKLEVYSKESKKEIKNTKKEHFQSWKGYKFDLRPHANIKLSYLQYGAFCGFSLGTTNYQKGVVGNINPTYAYSQLWRIGFSYLLN